MPRQRLEAAPYAITSVNLSGTVAEGQLPTNVARIKPHFFLNAISTLSSMNSQGRGQQIKGYVESLSKNIRYMFKSGLHTVTVKEEIRHIENYFDMQAFKYPNCAFYFIDLPAELEGWRIPQMLIQTFVENEFKYAISRETVLTVIIKVSLSERNGQQT